MSVGGFLHSILQITPKEIIWRFKSGDARSLLSVMATVECPLVELCPRKCYSCCVCGLREERVLHPSTTHRNSLEIGTHFGETKKSNHLTYKLETLWKHHAQTAVNAHQIWRNSLNTCRSYWLFGGFLGSPCKWKQNTVTWLSYGIITT